MKWKAFFVCTEKTDKTSTVVFVDKFNSNNIGVLRPDGAKGFVFDVSGDNVYFFERNVESRTKAAVFFQSKYPNISFESVYNLFTLYLEKPALNQAAGESSDGVGGAGIGNSESASELTFEALKAKGDWTKVFSCDNSRVSTATRQYYWMNDVFGGKGKVELLFNDRFKCCEIQLLNTGAAGFFGNGSEALEAAKKLNQKNPHIEIAHFFDLMTKFLSECSEALAG